jgi:hypothetical protein
MSLDSSEIDDILAEEDDQPPLSETFVQNAVTEIMESLPPSLNLLLDYKYFVAGERVEGELVLDLPREMSNLSLSLFFGGGEGVEIYSQKVLTSHLTREIFSHESVLRKLSLMTAGRHVFPFSYKLPSHIPATFSYSGEDQSGNYVKSLISYMMIGKLVYSGDESLSTSCEVCIRNKESRENHRKEASSVESIQGLCCLNKGSSSFTIQVVTHEDLIVNQTVSYKLIPDNSNCAVPINHVIAEVVLEMEFSGKEKNCVIVQRVSSLDRVTWIAAFSAMVYEKDFEFKSDLKVSEGDKNTSSVETNLIKAKYFLQITVQYDLSFRKQQSFIRLPIYVNPKGILAKERSNLPTGWNCFKDDTTKIFLDN